jgi:P-type Ca2+ transporter type 2C
MNVSSSLQVTAVGLNTEWGLLMASISEDNNEETPLQVSPFIFHWWFDQELCFDTLKSYLHFMVYFMGLFFFFKVRLNGVATFIGIAGLSVAAMVLVVLFAR